MVRSENENEVYDSPNPEREKRWNLLRVVPAVTHQEQSFGILDLPVDPGPLSPSGRGDISETGRKCDGELPRGIDLAEEDIGDGVAVLPAPGYQASTTALTDPNLRHGHCRPVFKHDDGVGIDVGHGGDELVHGRGEVDIWEVLAFCFIDAGEHDGDRCRFCCRYRRFSAAGRRSVHRASFPAR